MHPYHIASLLTPLLVPRERERAQRKELLNNKIVITCRQPVFVNIKGYIWHCIQDFDRPGCVICLVRNHRRTIQ